MNTQAQNTTREPDGYVVHYSGKMAGPSAGHAGIVSSVTTLDGALSLKGDDPKRTVRAVYLDAPGDIHHQGAEAVRLLAVMRDLANRAPEASINRSWVLALIDLAKHEAEAMGGSPFVQVLKTEASAYGQIIALLGLEEEGDPVAEVERLLGIADKWFKGERLLDISDAMVDAYLAAQRQTVEEADKFGRPNVGGLHTNTVREACRNGLRDALITAGAKKP